MLRRAELPDRKNKLRPRSKGLCATKRAQRRAYQAEPMESCAACGTSQRLEHSHILSQGLHKEHRNNPLNWLPLCHAHHRLWEDNKVGFAAQYPDAFAEKMRRMELVDAAAFEFFKMKHPTLF